MSIGLLSGCTLYSVGPGPVCHPWSFLFFTKCVCPCTQEWEEKRRQNIEQMKEEMEKLAEYERGQGVSEQPYSIYIYISLSLQ